MELQHPFPELKLIYSWFALEELFQTFLARSMKTGMAQHLKKTRQ